MEFVAKYQAVFKKVGIVIGVYLAVKYVVPLIVPFLIAALAAWWLRPAFVRLEKWLKLKPGISAVLFLVTALLLVGSSVYYLGGQLMDLCSDFLSGFAEEGNGPGREAETSSGQMLSGTMVFVEQVLWNCCEAAERLLGFPAKNVEQVVLTQVRVLQDRMEQGGIFEMFDGSVSAVKGLGKVAAGTVVGVIAFVMLCADFDKIKEEASGSAAVVRLVSLGRGIKEAIGSYVKAQCIMVVIIMGICVAGFLLTGSPYAVVLGLGTGLLDALPVLGTSVVIVPWLIAEVIRGQYGTAIILGLTYGACALTREILEPRLVGKRLGLFPVLVLLSVYVGVNAYGVSGIILGPVSLLVIQELWRKV